MLGEAPINVETASSLGLNLFLESFRAAFCRKPFPKFSLVTYSGSFNEFPPASLKSAILRARQLRTMKNRNQVITCKV